RRLSEAQIAIAARSCGFAERPVRRSLDMRCCESRVHARLDTSPGDFSMALDQKAEAALALHRFGCGPRAGSIAAIASEPRGAFLAELDRPNAGQISNPDLMASGAAARAAFNFRQERQAKLVAERKAERQRATNGPGQEGMAESMENTMEAKTTAVKPDPV